MPIPLDIPIRLGREEAQRLAAEELSKLRYGLELPPWATAFKERITRLLDRILEAMFGLDPQGDGAGGGSGAWYVLILVLVLVAAVALVVWRVGLPRWNSRRVVGQVDADSEVSAKQYRSLAAAAAARGDWRTAVREGFRSLVRELESRTILDPRPSRTALEVATLAGRLMPARWDELFTAAGIFSDVEYGDAIPTPEHYAQLSALERTIVAGADEVDLAAAEAEVN